MRPFNTIFRMLLLVLYVVEAGFMLTSIRIDNSIERWLPGNSRQARNYKKFLEDFNTDALLILTIENSDSAIIRDEVKKRIGQINELDHVISVNPWPVKNIRYKKKKNNDLITYIIRFEPYSHLDPNRPELVRQVDRIFSDYSDKAHLAGTGVIYEAINGQTEQAMRSNLFFGILIIGFVLIILLRSIIPVIQTVCIALGGVASIIYASVIFNIQISLIHTIIPVIILFYSTSISLHILFHAGNFREVLVPSLVVMVTTAIGFAVFYLNKIPLLNDFATIGLSGVMGVLIWSLIIFYPGTNRYNVPNGILSRFHRFSVPRKKFTIPAFLIISLLLIPGLFQIRAEIYSLAVLNDQNKAFLDHQYIESKIGNYFPLEYTVDERIMDRKQVSRWVNEVYQLGEIDAAIVYYQLPGTLNLRDLGYQSKRDPYKYRLTFMIPLMSTSKGMMLVDSIQNISKKYFGDKSPELTGFMTLYGNVVEELFSTFRQSLLLAFIIIFVIITIFLRNFRLIQYALIVNVFPIVAMLGMMGWLGINLDMVTIPVGCLLISIVVDDTIHLMFWYKKQKDLAEALRQAGPGIFFTSVVLSLGFIILLFSIAPPIRFFAILSLIALITALMGDLILLPSLLKK